MSASSQHRILRQILELDVGSAAGAQEVQDTLAIPFRDGNLPGLEQLFDRIASPNVHVRVDRLEIDLGTVTGTGWFEVFFDRLRGELKRALESAGSSDTVDHAEVAISRCSAGDHAFQRLLFYLEYGRLPWWSSRPADATWIDEASTQMSPHQWQAMLSLMQRSEHAQVRLSGTVGERVLERAVLEWGRVPEARRALQVLASFDGSAAEPPFVRGRFWQPLIRLVVSGAIDGPQFVREFVCSLPAVAPPADSARPIDVVEQRVRRWFDAMSTEAPSLREPWAAWVREVLDDGPESLLDDITGRRTPDIDMDDSLIATDQAGRDSVAGDDKRRRQDSPGADGPESEAGDDTGPDETALPERVVSMQEWMADKRAQAADSQTTPAFRLEEDELTDEYVDGAGIVIVHPFLSELFESLGLLRDDEFIDDAARHRGVHLIAYLTFGAAATPEYELLLAKLLCNLAWEVPLADIELDDEDKAACDELLAAVLAHWSVLQGCSVQWMREQYFLRDGKLEPVDHGWRLTVERHAQDVLLAKLPWGFGMIRLPWQASYLYLNWLD